MIMIRTKWELTMPKSKKDQFLAENHYLKKESFFRVAEAARKQIGVLNELASDIYKTPSPAPKDLHAMVRRAEELNREICGHVEELMFEIYPGSSPTIFWGPVIEDTQ
jgi:hypothetical protein